MKRMTKKYMKELLKNDNHLEALAYFCNRIAKCKTYNEALRKREDDWEKVIKWCREFEEDWYCEEDYSDNFLRVDTGIYCVIEREFI